MSQQESDQATTQPTVTKRDPGHDSPADEAEDPLADLWDALWAAYLRRVYLREAAAPYRVDLERAFRQVEQERDEARRQRDVAWGDGIAHRQETVRMESERLAAHATLDQAGVRRGEETPAGSAFIPWRLPERLECLVRERDLERSVSCSAARDAADAMGRVKQAEANLVTALDGLSEGARQLEEWEHRALSAEAGGAALKARVQELEDRLNDFER